MDENQILEQAIQSALGKPCLLCGKAFANGAGVFVPNNPPRWGAPLGKDRFLVYPMCDECRILPDIQEKGDCPSTWQSLARGCHEAGYEWRRCMGFEHQPEYT